MRIQRVSNQAQVFHGGGVLCGPVLPFSRVFGEVGTGIKTRGELVCVRQFVPSRVGVVGASQRPVVDEGPPTDQGRVGRQECVPGVEDRVQGVASAGVALGQARGRPDGGCAFAVYCASACCLPGEGQCCSQVVGEASAQVGGVGQVD